MAQTLPRPVSVALGEAGYTITVELSRVIPAQVVYKNEYDKEGVKVQRQVEEQGRLVLRDSSAADLIARAAEALNSLIPFPSDATE